MIDDITTYHLKGYKHTDLTPKSHKKVWAICDVCGEGRWVTYAQYRALCHPCRMKQPATRKKISVAQTGKKHSAQARKNMGDSHRGEKHYNYGKHLSDEQKAKISATQTGKKHSAQSRKNMGESRKGTKRSAATRKKMSESQKKSPKVKAAREKAKITMLGKNNPMYGKKHAVETLKKMSETHKKTPPMSKEGRKRLSASKSGKKHHFYGKHLSDEHKAKISVACSNPSEEWRQKISDALSGEKSVHWLGGISFEPYCKKFNARFKEKVRQKYGRRCFICGKTEAENVKRLSVHHVNYNKKCVYSDDDTCRFVPLCSSCHSKTNKNRDEWEKNIMAKLKIWDGRRI